MTGRDLCPQEVTSHLRTPRPVHLWPPGGKSADVVWRRRSVFRTEDRCVCVFHLPLVFKVTSSCLLTHVLTFILLTSSLFSLHTSSLTSLLTYFLTSLPPFILIYCLPLHTSLPPTYFIFYILNFLTTYFLNLLTYTLPYFLTYILPSSLRRQLY